MAAEQTSGRPGGAVAEVKDKGEEFVSSAQEQVSAKAHELGEQASFQVREQLDQRSTQAGEQVQAMGSALQSGVEQLRSEGKEIPAKVMTQVAERAEDLGAYLAVGSRRPDADGSRALRATPSMGDCRSGCLRRIRRVARREGFSRSSL